MTQKKCLKYIIKLLYILFVILIPVSAQTSEYSLTLPLSKEKSLLYSEYNTAYYYTQENYTLLSSSAEFLNQKSDHYLTFFRYINFDFSLGYTLYSWFELDIFLDGIWLAQSEDGNQTHFSGSKINRAGMSFRIQPEFYQGGWIIPEFSFSIPFYTLPKNVDLLTDNGSIHLTPSIWLYKSILNIIYPFGNLSFLWREYSSLLKYKLGLLFKAHFAEIGFYSYGFWPVIINNRWSNQLHLLKNLPNANSLKIASVSPTVFGFTTWISWHFPYITLRFSGDLDINGQDYAKGYSVLASFITHFSPTKSRVEEIFD